MELATNRFSVFLAESAFDRLRFRRHRHRSYLLDEKTRPRGKWLRRNGFNAKQYAFVIMAWADGRSGARRREKGSYAAVEDEEKEEDDCARVVCQERRKRSPPLLLWNGSF